jgi:hypothetical protein
MERLNKKGTMTVIIIFFLLMLVSVGLIIELTLLQRVEGKRYAQRDNSIHTANALIDLMIYNTTDFLSQNYYSELVNTGFTIDPVTSVSITDMGYQDYDRVANKLSHPETMNSSLRPIVVESGDGTHLLTLINPGPNVGVNRTKYATDIYSLVENTVWGAGTDDGEEFEDAILGIMDDKVKANITWLPLEIVDTSGDINNPAKDIINIDYDSIYTDYNFDDRDTLMLRPIRLKYYVFFGSYHVEKILTLNYLYLDSVLNTSENEYTVTLKTDIMKIEVEEYNCYE